MVLLTLLYPLHPSWTLYQSSTAVPVNEAMKNLRISWEYHIKNNEVLSRTSTNPTTQDRGYYSLTWPSLGWSRVSLNSHILSCFENSPAVRGYVRPSEVGPSLLLALVNMKRISAVRSFRLSQPRPPPTLLFVTCSRHFSSRLGLHRHLRYRQQRGEKYENPDVQIQAGADDVIKNCVLVRTRKRDNVGNSRRSNVSKPANTILQQHNFKCFFMNGPANLSCYIYLKIYFLISSVFFSFFGTNYSS